LCTSLAKAGTREQPELTLHALAYRLAVAPAALAIQRRGGAWPSSFRCDAGGESRAGIALARGQLLH